MRVSRIGGLQTSLDQDAVRNAGHNVPGQSQTFQRAYEEERHVDLPPCETAPRTRRKAMVIVVETHATRDKAEEEPVFRSVGRLVSTVSAGDARQMSEHIDRGGHV